MRAHQGRNVMRRLMAGAGVALVLAAIPAASAAADDAMPIYKRAAAPVQDRVHDLLGRMTLEEKVAQLESEWTVPFGGASAAGLYKDGKVDEAIARRTLSNGIGTFVPISLSGKPETVVEGVAMRNAIQAWVVKNTRLGIPLFFHGEALHGAVVTGATSFPQANALGSTWDPDLLRQMFGVVAKEARAAGNAMVLAPVFDIARDPRFGRVEEQYSEDPYMVGAMGVAAVQGLQGKGPAFDQDHVVATAKHYVHGQPENGTNGGPNDFSERTMRTVFLKPFEMAVKEGKIGAIMPSYNENTGGIPSNSNPWLMKDILRKEWGFTGLTVSDYLAVGDLATRHFVAKDVSEAGILAFNSGLDMELPNRAGFPALVGAVRAGRVSEAEIDQAVSRVLTTKFNMGLFEHPYTDPKRTRIVGDKANAPLARKVAEEAIILLKNDKGLLPLDPSAIKTLAVIGPNADKARIGGYSAMPPYFVTVLDGIRQRVGPKVKVSYAEGVRISEPDASPTTNKMAPFVAPSAEKDAAGIAQAVETARAADVVVLVLGENETVAREGFGAGLSDKPSFGDSDNLELPGQQNELVREIMKLGKPTVAILLNGRPLYIEQLSQAAPAIIEGWYLGQETGNAMAGVLFGDVNPSGRLTVTIARNVGQLPVFYYREPIARVGYVYNSNAPLYPFGYGLSYTTFTYGKPTLDKPEIDRDGTAKVSVNVTNSGKRAGDEVVQMYVHPKVSSVAQPVMRLAGFERIHLNAGETRTVSFNVGPEQLAIWDRQMKHVVEPGVVDVLVGSNVQQTASVPLAVRP